MDCNFTKKIINLHCKTNIKKKKTHSSRSTVYEHSNLKFKSLEIKNFLVFYCKGDKPTRRFKNPHNP